MPRVLTWLDVDEGSLPGIGPGSHVAIRYGAAGPRMARIDGATRTYWWKNLRSFGILALLLLASDRAYRAIVFRIAIAPRR